MKSFYFFLFFCNLYFLKKNIYLIIFFNIRIIIKKMTNGNNFYLLKYLKKDIFLIKKSKPFNKIIFL